MTDKETLLLYRLRQAEETLCDAEKMLENKLSTRSVANRAYYAMYYSVLALFIWGDVSLKTSKHAGVLSIFDREFIHTGKIDKYYSKLFHQMFIIRQEGDYKELSELTDDEAVRCVERAKEFLNAIKEVIKRKDA